MNRIHEIGHMALGSRLRALSDTVTKDAAALYQLYGVDIKPKWFPIFYILIQDEAACISDLAQDIGHSHPSVVKIVQEMKMAGLVARQADPADGRKTQVVLTEYGKKMARQMAPQCEDVTQATEALLAAGSYRLWDAIEELEYLLQQKSLYRRVLEQKKAREAQLITIVDYIPAYQSDFRDLNVAWIQQYFTMEAADYQALDHPQQYIIDRGGHILMARYEGETAGVCALVKMDDPDYDYELAKMAVDPKFQGKGIGWLLGRAIIERAQILGAKAIFLESNTRLEPAIRLYEKLGFERIHGRPSPYERSNIQMGLQL